jgi:hypothetical protein
MIVCHCNVITRAEIVSTIETMLAVDAWQLIVPLKVYHAMEKRGRCCGCLPNVIDIIVDVTTAWHAKMASPEADIIDFVARIRAAHQSFEAERLEARQRMALSRAA